MATLNGAFSGIVASRVYPYITYTSTQNATTNSSSVTVTLTFISISAYYGYGTCASTYLYCNGSVSKGSIAFNVAAHGSDEITSTTQTVYHDANGNASITVGASGDTDIAWNTFNFSTTYTLPTITRATTVTSTAASSVGETSATVGGNVTDAGVPVCTDRGAYWGTTAESQTNKVSSGSGSGTFNVNITGLTGGTKYYFKAFSTNTSGTAYGSVLNFTTTTNIPTVSTDTTTDIAATTVTSGGNVTSDHGASVTTRGVCYSTSAVPTTSDTTVDSGSGTGTFVCNLTGLQPNTKYYIRAYAINSVGTAYGTETNFTTISGTPTVTTTSSVTSISTSGGTVAGEVVSDNGATITERGFVYALIANPTTANSKATVSGTTGVMSKALTGLTSATLYHFRAYATNSYGTSYGSDYIFTTKPTDPSGLTCAVIDKTQIDLTWTKGSGNYTIIRSGATPPANINSGTLVYQGTGTSFSDTGLSIGTHYYYRAWSATTADWSVAYSVSYSSDDNTTVSDFTDTANALTDDTDYATIPTNDGQLLCQVSKDGGTTWSIAKSITFSAGVETKEFGTGQAETWGVGIWNGDDVGDTNFRVKIIGGSGLKSYQTFKDFGIIINASYILTGVKVSVKAAYNSTNLLLYFVKVDTYYGSSPLPVGAGSLAYDSTLERPTYYNSGEWVPIGGGSKIIVSETAPANPQFGDLWIDTSLI